MKLDNTITRMNIMIFSNENVMFPILRGSDMVLLKGSTKFWKVKVFLVINKNQQIKIMR